MEPTLYTITPIAPRQLRVKAAKFKWNLAQPDLDSVVNNPITTSDDATLLTAVSVLTRTDAGFEGHTYYLEEENTPHGWDSADCELVVAEPMPQPHIAPKGAMPVPFQTSDLVLDVDVPAFRNRTDAFNHTNPVAELTAGDYLIFNETENGMLFVGQSRDSQKYYINPADNQLPLPEPVIPGLSNFVGPRESSVVPEPIEILELPEEPKPEPVEDWKASYEPFYPPKTYVVNQPGRVWNLDERGESVTVMLRKGEHVNVYGTVVRDDMLHYRLKVTRDTKFEWWLCAPQFFNGRAVLTLQGPTWLEKLYSKAQEAKSIFTSEEPKLIDSTTNPYTHKEGK